MGETPAEVKAAIVDAFKADQEERQQALAEACSELIEVTIVDQEATIAFHPELLEAMGLLLSRKVPS